MDRKNLQSFIEKAESDLASIRSSLLIVAQTSDASGLTIPRRNLARLEAEASINGLDEIGDLLHTAIDTLDGIAGSPTPNRADVYVALDIVANIEAAFWKIPLGPDQFLGNISDFVDASFGEIMPHAEEAKGESWEDEGFEIDEETLDVFRSEADELLTNIANNLSVLGRSPGDQNALWDIRRNAHTFKGAAGIVGLSEAAKIAHRIEDVLDKIVELRLDVSPPVLEFLDRSSEKMHAIVTARDIDATADVEAQYLAAIEWLSAATSGPGTQGDRYSAPDTQSNRRAGDHHRPATAPIVRISLERLDDLLNVSRSLLVNRSALAERFTELSLDTSPEPDALQKLESIIASQRSLTDELHAKLLRIRMVRFGTIETRLSRAVHVTCLDEGKKARVEIENGDVEIDTQIIDALIEPLLHLLKNAVVHGIESPDTRRLLGKPEIGTIRIRVEADTEALVLSASDDGGGISLQKLKDKAVANNIIDSATAQSLDDRDAIKLIFDRGLTTAEKIDLNAGRGVGMSIVKESVESRGGRVMVESEPQRGTTFTILMPLTIVKPEPQIKVQEPTDTAASEPLAPLVLIVDDSASIRRHSAKIVENAGFRVITANSGADALELLLNGTFEPDLIFSDIEMPQIDGWEFLEYVKTDENFGHIPVVMVTSLDSDEHRGRANDLGASDYVVKPFVEADLTETNYPQM